MDRGERSCSGLEDEIVSVEEDQGALDSYGEVFEKTASLSDAATNVGNISTAADTNIGDRKEMGEGLEPSMYLNQEADQPMSPIFGLRVLSCRDNMLSMETVISVQREKITDIGKEDDVPAASPPKEEEEMAVINNIMGGMGLVPTLKETQENIPYSVVKRDVMKAMEKLI